MKVSLVFDKYFNLFLLSKYRTQLMGVAALMIILCHAPQYGVDVHGILRKLLVFLNIGVDIFLFLSGMGCCFSLMKPHRYFPWLKKRFIRLLIPYTIILLMLRVIGFGIVNISWSEWLLYFSTLRFWTHHDGMWYIALLVLLYPLAPFFFKIFEHSKNRALSAIILLVLILLITHIQIKTPSDLTNSILINLQWAFKRIVSFILGMYLAPYIKRGLRVNIFYIMGASAFGCVLFHFLMRDVFYSWLYVLPVLLLFCLFFDRLSEKSVSDIFFLWLGSASLESYLTNIGIKALMPLYLDKYLYLPLFAGHYLDYSFVIILGLCLTYITNKLSNKVISKTATT